MTMKDRILRVLNEKGLEYSDLLNELNYESIESGLVNEILTEPELDRFIETLNTPLLERVSKILGIPLYSFYYDPNKIVIMDLNKNKFYNKDIWKDDKENPLKVGFLFYNFSTILIKESISFIYLSISDSSIYSTKYL